MNRHGGPMNAFLESRRFGVLLVAQVFALFVAPLLSDADSEDFWFPAAVWSVLGAGVYAAANRRFALRFAAALFLLAASAWIGPDFLAQVRDDQFRLVTVTLCFVFTAYVVLEAILRHEHVTRETLVGGINVYLLLGFAFMLAHASVELGSPGAYTVNGDPLIERVVGPYDGRALATILYFSFTTLTTLGYGDIVPQSDAARLLTTAEAVVGQLYIAIFIGRIVGLAVSERSARQGATSLRHPGSRNGEPNGGSGA